jgi:glycosyltransferase involved in cell wall biosynthesis
MEEAVFISVCIPAYKRISFLERLLDSIQIQNFRHFEVVVTDDSPDNEVFEFCQAHPLGEIIRYFRNTKNLGTPENWNESLRHARGQWIKLMHDDDWFAHADALKIFADSARLHPEVLFFFCNYSNVYMDSNIVQPVRITRQWLKILKKDTRTLISGNQIGPPSVVFHKRSDKIYYDPALKWLVDIDFYNQFLKTTPFLHISEDLVRVGLGEEQVTKQVFGNAAVEIPENLFFLNKIGIQSLNNWYVYDAYWRFIRNLDIRSMSQIREVGYEQPVPGIIASMIRFQSFIPKAILKTGIFSKSLMFMHFFFNYAKRNRG